MKLNKKTVYIFLTSTIKVLKIKPKSMTKIKLRMRKN